MAPTAKKLATVEDLLSIPEEKRVELMDGEIIYHGQPLQRHGASQGNLGAILNPFARRDGGSGGPGGWWIVVEAGVRYGIHTACRHDLAGWRRGRLPELLDEEYVSVTPDWVCEILSPSNRKHDLVRKKAILHRAKTPHYWIVDPEEKTVSVLRWHEDGYLSVSDAGVGDKARLEPFEAIEIDVSALFGE